MDERPIKLRWVTMVFPRDLTEHEQNILIANLQAVRNGTKDELLRTYDKLQRKRFEHLAFIPGMKIAIDFMKSRALRLAGGSANEFFSLGRTNQHTYHFGYAHDDLKAINASISLLGRTLKLPEPTLIGEGSIVQGIKKYVIRDMGFKEGEVTVTVSDEEPKEE